MDKFQKDTATFKTNVSASLNGMKKSIAGIVAALGSVGVAMAAAGVANATKDAMKYEAALGQLNLILKRSAGEFQTWAEANAASLGFSQRSAMQFGAVYANLASTITKSTQETSTAAKNLMRATAVVATATARSVEDVQERFRSGLLGNTEAIEDLGIYANVAMLETSDAFKRLAGDKSWLQLDFQTQQQIRLYAILEQAAKKYGVSLLDNTASATSKFTAGLQDIKLQLGLAFMPIWNAVLPALTAMANAISRVLSFVAQMSSALFGQKEVAGQVADNITAGASAAQELGDAYAEAGAKAKRGVASFDQINQLAESSGSGGAGGNAAADVASLVPQDLGSGFIDKVVDISDQAKKMLEKIKQAVKPVSDAFGDLRTQASKLWDTIKNLLPWEELAKIWAKLQLNKLEGFFTLGSGVLQTLNGVLTILKGIVTLDFNTVLNGLKDIGGGLGKVLPGLLQAWTGIDVTSILDNLKGMVSRVWTEIKTNVEKLFPGITQAVKNGWKELVNWEAWSGVFSKVSQGWTDIRNGVSSAWQGIRSAIAEAWGKLFDGTEITWPELKETIQTLWTDIKNAVGPAWDEIRGGIKKVWDGITGGTEIVWDALTTTVGGVWTAIRDGVAGAWTEIREAVKTMWNTFTDGSSIAWKSINNILAGAWKELKGDVGRLWGDIKQAISDKWTEIKELDWDDLRTVIGEVWTNLKSDTVTAWDEMKETIKGSINWVIDRINSFIGKINSISIDIPSVTNPFNGETIFGGASIGMPKIPSLPKLARGGFTDGTTYMGNYIAGEAGRELIVPLENTSFTDKIASALGTAVLTAMQMGQSGRSGGDIVFTIDGVEFARVAKKYFDQEGSRVGGVQIRTT